MSDDDETINPDEDYLVLTKVGPEGVIELLMFADRLVMRNASPEVREFVARDLGIRVEGPPLALSRGPVDLDIPFNGDDPDATPQNAVTLAERLSRFVCYGERG